jgi:hypothetical protein
VVGWEVVAAYLSHNLAEETDKTRVKLSSDQYWDQFPPKDKQECSPLHPDAVFHLDRDNCSRGRRCFGLFSVRSCHSSLKELDQLTPLIDHASGHQLHKTDYAI